MTDKTIIDLDDALNRALGDAAFLRMMFEEFQDALPEFVSSIEKAVEKGDMSVLDRIAHQLKGASANLGVVSVSAAALNLERIGKTGQADGAHEALEALKIAIEDFNKQLSDLDWTIFPE